MFCPLVPVPSVVAGPSWPVSCRAFAHDACPMPGLAPPPGPSALRLPGQGSITPPAQPFGGCFCDCTPGAPCSAVTPPPGLGVSSFVHCCFPSTSQGRTEWGRGRLHLGRRDFLLPSAPWLSAFKGPLGGGLRPPPALPGEGSASRQRPGDASIKPPTRLPAAGRVGEAVTQRFLGVGDQVARCSPLPVLQQGGSVGRDLW